MDPEYDVWWWLPFERVHEFIRHAHLEGYPLCLVSCFLDLSLKRATRKFNTIHYDLYSLFRIRTALIPIHLLLLNMTTENLDSSSRIYRQEKEILMPFDCIEQT